MQAALGASILGFALGAFWQCARQRRPAADSIDSTSAGPTPTDATSIGASSSDDA